MEWFELPTPIFSCDATEMPYHYDIGCFPLADGKVVITDYSCLTFLFEADLRHGGAHVRSMPNLHKPKKSPISLFVPSADADIHLSGGGSLYLMERILKLEVGGSALSDQFETLVCDKLTMITPVLQADCRVLPPPPFVHDLAYYRYHRYPPRIIAYVVVGSNIFISVERAGTYCLDTLRNTWDKVGEWTLPFYGKVEYVPKLKLWFGLSAEDKHLAAADLSDMNTEPQLVDIDSLKELDRPEEWKLGRDSQLVNLGSGRFCMARFFKTMTMYGDSLDEINHILVLTGVEVIPPVHDGNYFCSGSGTGKVKLDIRKHKSRCHMSDCISNLTLF